MNQSRTRTARGVVATLALATLLSFPVTAAPRPHFSVVDLGALPGGRETFPARINNQGQVVGSTIDAGGIRRAFQYQDGVITAVPYVTGNAFGINDAGAIVGQMFPGHGFLYDSSTLLDLNPIVGADWVAAASINDAGVIVGWAAIGSSVFPAFWLSNQNVSFFPLPTNGYYATAFDINNAGQAVGELGVFTNSTGGVRTTAVLYEPGIVSDLGTLPGGLYSSARGISDLGHVVGSSGVHFGGPAVANATHAFIYRNASMVDLGTLPGDFNSYGMDINSADWVVGASQDGNENIRAFLYADGKTFDLNDLVKKDSPWHLGSADAINEQGQIVGWGRINGVIRGFLLTPKHPIKTKPGKRNRSL